MDEAIVDPAEPSFEVSSLDPTLARELVGRLFARGALRQDAEHELQVLEAVRGSAVYAETIYLLSHLRIEADEAKTHWNAILEHRDTMERKLGYPVELRLALLRYFTEVHRKLVNPKIIELSVFERTCASAYSDELTGLRNYRYFVESLAQELLRSDQYGVPVSLVMADVDSFKQYNDHNGHQAGNDVLVLVARVLKDTVRPVDLVARFGGEEFAVVLPSTTKESAMKAAERIRSAIEQESFPHASSQPGGRLTLSAGVATYPGDAAGSNELVHSADRALYEAKARGRNRIAIFADNLRSFPRAFAEVDGTCRLLSGDEIPLRVLEISETGMSFRTDHEIRPDSLIDTWLRLPGGERPFRAAARVVRAKKLESGEHEAAARFIELATSDRGALSQFVRRMTTRIR
jgi:diguanylate cyclase (GGDEF)-like protein